MKSGKSGSQLPHNVKVYSLKINGLKSKGYRMEDLKTKKQNPDGLHKKYIVAKSNGKPLAPNSEYFVLRVDLNGKDKRHAEACRKAVITYAENIADHLPDLAKDLINRYKD